jgi:hypothetical protein
VGGLCERHHAESLAAENLRRDALHALHRGMIEDELLANDELREELEQLQERWVRACDAVNSERSIPLMPLDEAKYAVEWCIALAQELVLAQRALDADKVIPSTLASTRRWVWERLHDLEKGAS